MNRRLVRGHVLRIAERHPARHGHEAPTASGVHVVRRQPRPPSTLTAKPSLIYDREFVARIGHAESRSASLDSACAASARARDTQNQARTRHFQTAGLAAGERRTRAIEPDADYVSRSRRVPGVGGLRPDAALLELPGRWRAHACAAPGVASSYTTWHLDVIRI